MAIVWVALGGACGATLRYLVVKFLSAGALFPVGTLVANVSGSFLIGLLAGSFFLDPKMSLGPKLFFQTGLLGAFTTFSGCNPWYGAWHSGLNKVAIDLRCVLSGGIGVSDPELH